MASTAPRRPRAIELDSNGRLREIVDESAKLFDERGYDRVSVEDIANASGIRKATLYHYIRSKDDILVLLHREFMRLVLDTAESREREHLDPKTRLVMIMSDILGLMKTHRGHVRVFFDHHRELPRRARAGIMAERDRYQAIVEAILSDGIAAGQFKNIDVRLATLGVFGMCNWAYQWYDRKGPLTPEQIADVFADIVINGIGARPDRP